MKLINVSYSDSYISLYCGKSGEFEFEKLTPDHFNFANIIYEISVINNPLMTVREESRINKKNVKFNNKRFILFFPLEELVNPNDCQISFYSLHFFLDNGMVLKYQIEQTYPFLELSTHSPIPKLKTTSKGKPQSKTDRNLQKGNISSNRGKPSSPQTSTSYQDTLPVVTATKEDIKNLFEDSLQKFKSEIKEANLQETIKKKHNSIDSNLKDFGMSLLCKLLLLVKYLNVLVDNDFQSDLNQFLQYNFVEKKAFEGEG